MFESSSPDSCKSADSLKSDDYYTQPQPIAGSGVETSHMPSQVQHGANGWYSQFPYHQWPRGGQGYHQDFNLANNQTGLPAYDMLSYNWHQWAAAASMASAASAAAASGTVNPNYYGSSAGFYYQTPSRSASTTPDELLNDIDANAGTIKQEINSIPSESHHVLPPQALYVHPNDLAKVTLKKPRKTFSSHQVLQLEQEFKIQR